MKIKDLIKHLQTLDQNKQLVIIATDPTDWDYGMVVNKKSIELDEVWPCEDNGLEGELPEPDYDNDKGVDCYVIRLSC
jgi:hypothetical protein